MTPYEILGVSPNATAKEIKLAYRRGSTKHHPDKGGDPAKFNELKDAYDILSDSNRRAEYDKNGSTSKPGGVNQKAVEVIAKTFTILLSNYDVSSAVNYVAEIKKSLKATLGKYSNEKQKVKHHQQKCEKLLLSTEGEVMRGVIEHQISTCKAQMEGIQSHIAAAKRAQDIIKDCKCGADVEDAMRSHKQMFLDQLCR